MQPNKVPYTSSSSSATTYDAGLRRHFQRVYNVMATGLVLTGLTAWLVSSSETLVQTLYSNPILAIGIAFAPLLFILFGFTPNRVRRLSVGQLSAMFYGFSALFGVALAPVFLVYAGADITRVFFITAGMFAATSIYGYTTKKDLSGLGGLLVMGVIGLLIAIVVNLFMQSAMMDFVISCVGVLVYTGLTAYDTQNIKETYHAGHGDEANGKMAIMGSLSLYINFIMLFQFLLQLLGNRQ